jgi:hypothetical protein
MNYFDIFFQGKSGQEILNKRNTPEFNKDFNKAEVKPYFQSLYNELFDSWVKDKLSANNNLYNRNFNVISKDDFIDLSDDDFKILNDFLVRTEGIYLANWIFENDNENEYFRLFNFKGIINTLNNLENNPAVFFLNKHSFINIINTFLFGKWIDYYLREFAPLNQKRKYEQVNRHYFEIILNKAVLYTVKEIDTFNDSVTASAQKSADNNYWMPFKEQMKAYKDFLNNAELQEYKEELIVKSIYDFRYFRKEVLNEVSRYLITNEELKDENKLFTMTHKKRLLLYELLRHLEPQLDLPTNKQAYNSKSTSDKDKAESDKSFFFSTTPRFDDFQRNEVRKYFG